MSIDNKGDRWIDRYNICNAFAQFNKVQYQIYGLQNKDELLLDPYISFYFTFIRL